MIYRKSLAAATILSLLPLFTPWVNATSDTQTASSTADRLYRLDCGHSLANDEFGVDARRERRQGHRVFLDVLSNPPWA